MKFSEKLKALRRDNHLTQDELAERLYVTRTAVSKWETDKGFPGIDSLKLLSEQFHISIDELISDSDIDTQRRLNEQKAATLYWVAIGCFAACAILSVVGVLLQLRWLLYVGYACMAAYIGVALWRTRYTRGNVKKTVVSLVLSRVMIGLIVALVLVFTILQTGCA